MTRDEAMEIVDNIIKQNVESYESRVAINYDPNLILSELIVNGLVVPNWEKNSNKKDWNYEGSSL